MIRRQLLVLASVTLVVGLVLSAPVRADVLGAADNYTVLGGTGISNTGDTVITGNIGAGPSATITGFPPGTVSGTTDLNNTAASNAQTALDVAITNLEGESATTLTGDLGNGRTLTPGNYWESSSASLTNTLTLNAENESSPVFFIYVDGTLTTAASSSVVVTNAVGGAYPLIYFLALNNAVLGADTSFTGDILSLGGITLDDAASDQYGALLSHSGDVTLDDNQVSNGPLGSTSAPEPPAFLLLACALPLLLIFRRKLQPVVA
jgi:hypothetical protein